METKCKEISNKKKETDKTEYFGNRRKQEKRSFAEVYKETNCKESFGYRKPRDNKRQRKKTNF